MIEAPRAVDVNEAIEALRAAPRIALIRAGQGVEAPNAVIEVARDLGRPRADVWEVAVWGDTLAVSGNDLRHLRRAQRGHRRPENVDAIRALTRVEPDGAKSIAATDASLGLRKTLP